MGMLCSSAYIENAASIITTYPFTLACWLNTSSTSATEMAMSIGSNTTRNSASIGTVTGNPSLNADNGTATQTTSTGASNPANSPWHFMVGRFISATNRRVSILNSVAGTLGSSVPSVAVHAQGTTNVTLSGFTRIRIGARADNTAQGWLGGVAEAWYTNTDIQPDGLQLSDQTLIALALYGPLAVPSIFGDVIEYRSLRYGLTSDQDNAGGVYYRVGTLGSPPVWTASGTPVLSVHPPARNALRAMTPRPHDLLQSALRAGVLFRRTLSRVGTGIGHRQVQHG